MFCCCSEDRTWKAEDPSTSRLARDPFQVASNLPLPPHPSHLGPVAPPGKDKGKRPKGSDGVAVMSPIQKRVPWDRLRPFTCKASMFLAPRHLCCIQDEDEMSGRVCSVCVAIVLEPAWPSFSVAYVPLCDAATTYTMHPHLTPINCSFSFPSHSVQPSQYFASSLHSYLIPLRCWVLAHFERCTG